MATGNLPGATYPASGVYYPGDNPAAEAAARQVAQDLGIAAVEARSDEDNRNFATARTPGAGKFRSRTWSSSSPPISSGDSSGVVMQ